MEDDAASVQARGLSGCMQHTTRLNDLLALRALATYLREELRRLGSDVASDVETLPQAIDRELASEIGMRLS